MAFVEAALLLADDLFGALLCLFDEGGVEFGYARLEACLFGPCIGQRALDDALAFGIGLLGHSLGPGLGVEQALKCLIHIPSPFRMGLSFAPVVSTSV
ncbi:MAG: hypothetical protein AB2814_11710 [Candidatus Sedimenticola endophacoides]